MALCAPEGPVEFVGARRAPQPCSQQSRNSEFPTALLSPLEVAASPMGSPEGPTVFAGDHGVSVPRVRGGDPKRGKSNAENLRV